MISSKSLKVEFHQTALVTLRALKIFSIALQHVFCVFVGCLRSISIRWSKRRGQTSLQSKYFAINSHKWSHHSNEYTLQITAPCQYTNIKTSDQVAHVLLGRCYEHGRGVTKDYLEARRLYTLASAQGSAKAYKFLNHLEQRIRTECPLLSGTSKRVVITGTSREDLNGRAGVATSFDHARGRYVVELDGSAFHQRLKNVSAPNAGRLAIHGILDAVQINNVRLFHDHWNATDRSNDIYCDGTDFRFMTRSKKQRCKVH